MLHLNVLKYKIYFIYLIIIISPMKSINVTQFIIRIKWKKKKVLLSPSARTVFKATYKVK